MKVLMSKYTEYNIYIYIYIDTHNDIQWHVTLLKNTPLTSMIQYKVFESYVNFELTAGSNNLKLSVRNVPYYIIFLIILKFKMLKISFSTFYLVLHCLNKTLKNIQACTSTYCDFQTSSNHIS